jgi:hypothetical protein
MGISIYRVVMVVWGETPVLAFGICLSPPEAV